tara:strand:+ start:1735 stop:2814 length:1080 start_codon:yes stop_codon:yes gene_type:complete
MNGFSFTVLSYPFQQLWSLTKISSLTPPSWRELIEVARWAPTIHNLQPHQVKIISDNEAELFYNPERLLPVEDPGSIFTTIALGVFIEHLSIAASPFGYKVIIDRIHNPVSTQSTKTTLFATLKLISTQEKEELNKSLIFERRTSRTDYNGDSLNKNTIQRLEKEARKFGHDFFYSENKEIVDFVIKLNEEALFEDLTSKPTRDELDKLFRYSKKEAKNYKDGLWTRCMGFSGALTKSIFKNYKRWTKGFRKKLLKKYYMSTFKGTSTICWFTGQFNNSEDWIKCGRMFARNWLIMTDENAYIHPFGSLITNVNANNKIVSRLTNPDNSKKIWMIFRAGYSKIPTRSFRLSTNQIIIKV